MTLPQLLTTEPATTLIITALGVAWTLFKSGDTYARIQDRRAAKALRIIESAAEATYRCYVRQIKKARADGKLSDEEQRNARELAKEKAIQIARRQGFNLARELGEDFLDATLSAAVTRLKK